MSEILVTGFGPFGTHACNASWEALRLAAPALPAGVRWRAVRLDVAWDAAPKQLLGAITPATRWALAFGVADDPLLRIERFAVNVADRETPDARGACYVRDSIHAAGPAAYETGLPRRLLLDRLGAAGLPACESHHAGSYLCNFVFYWLMDHVAVQRPDLGAGFIHVPPERCLPLVETARAMTLLIECLATCDPPLPG